MRSAVAALHALLLLALIALSPVAEGLASIEVEALIDIGSITVRIGLSGIDPTLFERIENYSQALNETTIPKALLRSLPENTSFTDASMLLDDEVRAINASFRLVGHALMDMGFNRTTMARIYRLKTIWRRTDVEAWYNETFLVVKLNFSSFFERPLECWERLTSYELGPGDIREALLLNTTVRDGLFENGTGRAVWLFVLPSGARLLRTLREEDEEFLVFEMLPGLIDILIASPFWPFLLVVLAVGIAVACRRASVRLVRPEEAS